MRSKSRWTLVVLIALAAVLRVPGLGEELWLDEALTVSRASMPVSEMFSALAHDNKPPLYGLMMHGWLAVFGDSEIALRCSSLLFGLLTVWLLHRFGSELAGPRCGFAAAAFYVVTPLSIYYSCEGRNYAMVSFAALLAAWSAHRAVSEQSRARDWVVHGAAFAGCLYIHLIAAPIALVGLALVVTSGTRRHLVGWVLSMVGAGVVFAPWASIAVQQVSDVGNIMSWVVPFWEGYPPALAIPLSLLAFMPGGQVPPFVALPTVDWLQPLLGVGAGTIVLLAAWPRVGFLEQIPRPVRVLVLSFVFLPLLVPFVCSFRTPVYLVGRTDFVVFPGFCLLAGVAYARLRSRPAAMGTLGLLVLTCVVSWPKYYESAARQHERGPLEKLAQSTKAGDLVICTDLSRSTAEYYLGRRVPGLRFESYPREVANLSGSIDRESYKDRAELLRGDAEAMVTLVRELESGRTAWMLHVEHPMNNPLLQAFERARMQAVIGGHYRLNQLGIQVRVARVVRQ